MAQLYYLGDTNNRGTYYFYAAQQNGWVVADLDGGRALMDGQLALVRVRVRQDVSCSWGSLEKCGLGNEGPRWLVRYQDLFPLLRDYGDELEVLQVMHPDGEVKPYGKAERAAARALRGIKKRLDREGPP